MKRSLRAPAVCGTALAAVLASAPPAAAHELTPSQLAHLKHLQALAPGIPTVNSDNITQVAGLPETAAISMEFARTGAFAYVSSTDTISVIDMSDPRDPQLRGVLVNALFENESMTYGERVVDGVLNRFVIAAVDLVQASPDDPTHVNADDGPEVVLVDVTDPDDPHIRSRTPLEGAGTVTTSTHTVQCVDQADCRYAYSAGTGSEFSVLDLTDLDDPKQLKTVPSPASGPGKEGFSNGAGHYWDFDGFLGWHTGSGGAAAYDVTDPVNPKLVAATNAKGRGKPINDFILHNSHRPNGDRFKPGLPPSIANGNVLIVTEEDYADEGDELVCSEAGSFQTWYIPDLDGAAYRAKNPTGKVQDVGTISPLDQVTAPSQFGGGVSTPVSGFCSAHWFDVHQDGFVALGHYGAGMRIMDVRDAKDIKQYGYVTGLATQVWDAYWVPERDSKGVVTGRKTNLVYTADAVRGVEVYEVTLPASSSPTTGNPPGSAPMGPRPASSPRPTGSGSLAATGLLGELPLAAVLLLLAAGVTWRRRALARR